MRAAVLALAALAVLLFVATCTTAPKLPEGVVKQSRTVDCAGTSVRVDFYFRESAAARPGVVVAHGFSRSRRHMAGWGVALVERGMVVAVLTQPHWAGHMRNADAIARLAEAGRRGEWPTLVNGRMGLVGFSMGGLTTLLAATRMENSVDAWVGLDPVDFEGKGAATAGRVKAPGLVLLAEPAPFNRHGNGVAMVKNYGGPLKAAKVKGATHCDPESPVDMLGQLACGWVNMERHALIKDSACGFLEEVLLGIPPKQPWAEGLEPWGQSESQGSGK